MATGEAIEEIIEEAVAEAIAEIVVEDQSAVAHGLTSTDASSLPASTC